MFALFQSPILFAWQSPFSHMGKNFRDGFDSSTTSQLFILVAVLVGIGIGITLLLRYFNLQDGVSYNRPGKLFAELCRAHELNRGQQQLLRRLAVSQQLAQPARLFLDPETFDTARKSVSEKDADGIATLRERIFG